MTVVSVRRRGAPDLFEGLPPGYLAPFRVTGRRGEDWRDRALCAQADPEEWYPEVGGSPRAAKRICADCPVRRQCLERAFASEDLWGIWGGLTTHERKAALRHYGLSRDVSLERVSGRPRWANVPRTRRDDILVELIEATPHGETLKLGGREVIDGEVVDDPGDGAAVVMPAAA